MRPSILTQRRSSCADSIYYDQEKFPVLWAWMGVLLLVFFCLLRSWQTLKAPGLYMEDSLLFSYYYGHFRPFSSLFVSHVGQNYLTVPPYFAAWIFSWFDVRMQPYLYQWWGFSWSVAACSVPFFSRLFRNRFILLLGPTVLGLVGLNDIYYWNTLIYSMYTGLLVLFSLLFYPPPKTWPGSAALVLLFIVLPWSGPYCVLLLPAGIIYLLLFGRDRKTLPIVAGICSTIVYFMTVQSHTTRLDQLKPMVVTRYLQVLVDKVLFLQLANGISLYWLVAVMLLLIFSWYCFRADPCFIKNITIMLCFVFGSLSLFFLSVKYPMYGHTLACHRLISTFFWLIVLLYISDRYLVQYTPPWPVSFAVLLGFASLVVLLNIRYPSLGRVSAIQRLDDFTRGIAWCEQVVGRQKNTYIIFRRPTSVPVMQLRVRIGSNRPDAVCIGSDNLPRASWKRFATCQ